MTTVNTTPNSQIPFTAAQIEKDCPARLQQIGREIAERLKKAERQEKLAADNAIAVDRLLAQAKRLCDDGGFKKFRELFCPRLAYVLSLVAFSESAREFVRVTSDKRAGRFAKTSVTADYLAKLGKLLTDTANLKKSEPVEPVPIVALPDNVTAAVGQPGRECGTSGRRSKRRHGSVT
jgi:hypothetical protein